MKRYLIIIVAVMMWGGVGVSTQSLADSYFSVGIQQDGRDVPIQDHQVVLQKKTLTIVLYFPRPEGILLNASFSSESYEKAKRGEPFDQIPGFTDLGMAEENFNPQTLLIVSKTAPHYWHYHQDGDHRFNDITQRNGMFVCRRIIAQIMNRDTTPQKLTLVKDLPEQELYLVFMKTEWSQDFTQQFEKQREYVQVIFK